MPFNGTEYWAAHNPQQYQTPSNYPSHQNQLNPSVGSFHPGGTEMQHYQGHMPPTPPFSNPASPNEMVQMHNHMMHSHFSHTKDIVALERKTKENYNAIEKTNQIVANDMRELQAQILELKEQMGAQMQKQSGMLTRRPRADQDFTPPDEFFRNFSKESIAEAYIAEAEDYEVTVVKLREQAEEICSGVGAQKPNTLKLLKGVDGDKKVSGDVEFACCGDIFTSMDEMLEHVGRQHGLHPPEVKEDKVDDHHLNTKIRDGDVTPTHIPPHRPKVPTEGQQPHVVEIKTPVTIPAALNNQPLNNWVPLHVRQMPPPPTIANLKDERFTFDFLRQNLGGEEWSPGFYFIKESTREKFLPIRSYWLLEEEFEPLLPSTPGQHGAKLTAFFNETAADAGDAPGEEDYLNVPVFIAQSKEKDEQGSSAKEYIYFGHYSQNRYSDRLDVEHVLENVPETVRQHHAKQLASVGRPKWVTGALMEHFFSIPRYDSVLLTNSQVNTPKTEADLSTNAGAAVEKRALEALVDYAEELKEWEKDARLKVSLLTPENLMDAFARPDAGGEDNPALRLWLEYFEFVKYDEEIVEFLAKVKQNPKKYPVSTGKQRAEQRIEQHGTKKVTSGKMVGTGSGVETIRPALAQTETNELGQQCITADKTPHREAKRSWDAESHKAAIKTGSKSHVGMRKPWEENAKKAEVNSGKNVKTTTPNGDLEVAKQLQREFGRRNGGKPPHLR